LLFSLLPWEERKGERKGRKEGRKEGRKIPASTACGSACPSKELVDTAGQVRKKAVV
jgi:hypothetical protein